MRLAALIAGYGLELAALHTGGVFYDEETAREQTLPNLAIIAAFAEAIGCNNVLISPAAKKEGAKTPRELATQNRFLQEACALFSTHTAGTVSITRTGRSWKTTIAKCVTF